jgi:MFS family permease
MSRTQRKVLTTACMTHATIHVYELAVPPLLLLIQTDFLAGDLQMGKVVTLYGMLFGLGALPAGYLVDRLGSRVLLLACLWGGALAVLGMALSPSLATFSIAAAFMGLSLSIYHPAGTALISHALPISGRVFALHGMAGNLGVAGASVIAGSVGALFGWRWALGALSLVGLVLGLRVLGLPSVGVGEARARRDGGRWYVFVLLLIGAGLVGVVYRGVTTFLPKLFATSYAEDAMAGTAIGGLLTTAALLVGLVGMYVAGRISDAGMAPAHVFLIGVVVQAPFMIGIGLIGGPAMVPLAMGFAFFHFFTQPPANQLVAELTPPRLRGLGYGIYFFMVFGAGSLGATLGGWLSERIGLGRAFPAMTFVLLPALVAMILLSFARRRRAGPPVPDPTTL